MVGGVASEALGQWRIDQVLQPPAHLLCYLPRNLKESNFK